MALPGCHRLAATLPDKTPARVEVSEIMISQNEPFQSVGHALIRRNIPWMAIKVLESLRDVRGENTGRHLQTVETR